MFSLTRRVLVGLAALLSFVPSALPAKTAVARPALWVVSDPDTTIYLFGTIHLLPKDVGWFGGTLQSALSGSDELVIETIIDEGNPHEFLQAMTQLAHSPGLPPLRERVSEDKRPALDAAVKASGIPPANLDGMETWAAAFFLLGAQFRGIGLQSEDGVEMVLRKAFAKNGKSVGALESNFQQLGFFDRLPEEAQLALLEGSIGTNQDMKTEFGSMVEAWTAGDVDRIAVTFDRDLAESPPLRDGLMVQRNRNWADWVAQRMKQPGKVMVAVGAGHLAGKDSVQQYLAAKGYTVHRLQ